MATAIGKADISVVGQMLCKAWADRRRLFSSEEGAHDYTDISSEYDGMSTKRPPLGIDLDAPSMDVHRAGAPTAYGSSPDGGLDL